MNRYQFELTFLAGLLVVWLWLVWRCRRLLGPDVMEWLEAVRWGPEGPRRSRRRSRSVGRGGYPLPALERGHRRTWRRGLNEPVPPRQLPAHRPLALPPGGTTDSIVHCAHRQTSW